MVISNRVAFWDNDSFVVVTKNCSKEQARRLLHAIAEADMAEVEIILPADAEPEPVVPGDEIEHYIRTDKPVFSNGRYQGLTPREVLEKDGDKGYGNLAFLSRKSSDADLVRDMELAMKEYFLKRFGGDIKVSDMSDGDCLDFFKYFGTIITGDDKKKILAQAGAQDFDSLIQGAGLEQLRAIILAVIKKNN